MSDTGFRLDRSGIEKGLESEQSLIHKISWIGYYGQGLIHEPPIRFQTLYEAVGGLGTVVAATSCDIFYFIRFM